MSEQETSPVRTGSVTRSPVAERSSARLSSYILGVGAVLVGLGLRLFYITHASLYIDEFTTVWAARQILAHGLPQFPSGAIYTQGLLYTYLDAGALALGDSFSPFLARLPSLALSMVTLAVTLYAARRLFRTSPVGLAAFWLAVDAEAIVWGARARTYALLQLLVLVAFLAWYHGAVDGDRPKARWLAIILLLAALVEQPLTLLLLIPFAIMALAAQGWPWLRQPVVWLQAGVVAVAVAARWGMYQLMIPAGTTVTTEPRAFVDLARPFVGLESLATFFTDPNRWIPALLLAGGAISLLVFRRSGLLIRRRPVLSIAFVLALVLLEMLLVAGTTWRSPRYLYPLLPLLFLGGEGVAVPILRRMAQTVPRLGQNRALTGLTGILVLSIALLACTDARAAASQEEWGYDRALAVVGKGWTEGDALATIAPAAAFVMLGHADYLAVEEGGQVLVVERDGRYIDAWTGLPLLDAPAYLAQALEAHPRLWIVIDEMRLNRHFSPEFLRLLWDRTNLIAFERGTFVFRSRPAEAPPTVARPLTVDFGGQLQLAGYSLSNDRPEPGETVTVTLYWAPEVPQGEYTAFVHAVDMAGTGVVGHDAPPLGGLYPAGRWPRSDRSQPFPDRHPLALPKDLLPGRYRLEVGLYHPGTLEPVGERMTLDFLAVGEEPIELQPESALARFGNAATLHLLGLNGDLVSGGLAHLQLAWQTGPAGFDGDWTLFLHLLDDDGQIAQQWDAPPTGGWYPTSFWKPGEVVLDDHTLDLSPMLVSGSYRLIAGLYRADGSRLPLDEGADFVELATIELRP